MRQLVVPDPDIPCRPGWCLQYVRQAFGAPAVEPTATAGWANADYRHEDWNFPAGCWVPVWFSLATEPAGHVALLAPDGSVYSTTHPTSTRPTRHPDMADMFNAYARYNPLTYLGWSEDISGVRVVGDFTLAYESATITPLEDELTAQFETDARGEFDGLRLFQADVRGELDKLRALDIDVRGDLANKGKQLAALTAANETLVSLLADKQGLTVEDIRDALAGAIADGIKVTVGNG